MSWREIGRFKEGWNEIDSRSTARGLLRFAHLWTVLPQDHQSTKFRLSAKSNQTDGEPITNLEQLFFFRSSSFVCLLNQTTRSSGPIESKELSVTLQGKPLLNRYLKRAGFPQPGLEGLTQAVFIVISLSLY